MPLVFYAGIATVLCLLIGYPLAYMIAFKAGRWRNLLLVLVVAPFFCSFILRTLAWRQILGEEGFIVQTLKVDPRRPGEHGPHWRARRR